jgi:hypothetical protein
MVMQYWIKRGMGAHGDAADAARIQQALWPLEAGGIPASEMARYFRVHGYRTFVFNGEWADLEEHLAKGRPLILALKAPDRGTRFHYVVVAGLDGRRGLVLFNDPARRKLLKLDRTSFEKAWKATDHWTLLALPQPGR